MAPAMHGGTAGLPAIAAYNLIGGQPTAAALEPLTTLAYCSQLAATGAGLSPRWAFAKGVGGGGGRNDGERRRGAKGLKESEIVRARVRDREIEK